MSRSAQKHFKFCLLNCENLFAYMDLWRDQDLANFNEKEWQALSSSAVPNKPLRKLRWLAETFRTIDADILALNEVGGLESLTNFNRHFLGDSYVCHLIEGNSDRGIDVGFLAHKRLPFKYELISHRRRPLNFLYPHEEDPNFSLPNLAAPSKTHYFSRDVLELRIFQPEVPTPRLIVLLTHLKSKLDPQGIDPAGRGRRGAELKALLQIYKEVRADFPKVPVLVAGDLNGEAALKKHDVEFAPLYETTDLKETFDLLKTPPTESATQVTFPRANLPHLIKIDHVFLSPELHDQLLKTDCRVHLYQSDLNVTLPYATSVEQRGALPSDHYPIVVAFSFPWP